MSGEALLPPGPKLPRVVQTAAFIIDPVRWVSACRRRYGDDAVTFSTLFDPRFVIVFEPDLIKLLFRGPPDQLRAGEANAVLGPVLGENSVLLADGADHLRQRKLMLPPFHGQRMRAYESTIEQATDRLIDSWPASGEPFALLPGMQALTLEVIMRAVFGVEDTDRREDLARRLREMLKPAANRLGIMLMLLLSGGRRGMGRAQRRLAEQRARVDEAIYAEIARRREAPDLDEREDILSMLLTARDEGGRAMTDVELRDELVTLLVAGHETTSAGLAWTFELLLRNPEVRARASEDDDYLDAAIKEALRARPVISGIGRKVRGEPFQLGRWTVPPGIEINPSIAGVHRRADRYPSPESFRPERFLGDDAPDGFTWIPFGGGTRRCLGASFALFEMKTVVRRVLERTSLEPVGKPDVGVRRGITFVPRNGVRVRQTSERLRSRNVASMPTTSSAASPR